MDRLGPIGRNRSVFDYLDGFEQADCLSDGRWWSVRYGRFMPPQNTPLWFWEVGKED